MKHEPNPQTGAHERISALRKAGVLSDAQSTAIAQAYGSTGSDGQTAAEVEIRSRQWPPAGQQFLAGAISEEALLRQGRRTSMKMGAGFGPLMATFHYLYFAWPRLALESVPSHIASWLVLTVLFGVSFGWLSHLLITRPALSRTIALRREAGPLQPIAGADAGQCHSCRGEEFQILGLAHWVTAHWILNPGLAFNELVLGQRVPKTTKICRNCGAQGTDCPHCHRAVDLMTWSGVDGFGNWSGLRCPHCGNDLPTLANAVAWIVRAPVLLVARLWRRGGSR
jgi:hypothetical protein